MNNRSIKKENIAVIIPMYRVEGHIQDVVQHIPDFVQHIIAVDDASPDQSGARLTTLKDTRLQLITHHKNRGVGGAMLTGFSKALELGASIVVKVDGDGQMPADHMPDLLQPILDGDADYAKGNRFTSSRSITRMPFIRRMGNLALSFVVKACSGYWNLFDPTNGYFALDAHMLKNLDLDRLHQRFFFEISLLNELNRNRAVVVDVPIPATYENQVSSLSIPRTLFEFPPLLLLAWLRRIWWQYFTFDFSVGSLFLVTGTLLTTFGGVWGIIWWVRSMLTNTVTTTGTVMIAVLPIILGVQLLLQFLALDIQSVPNKPHNPRKKKI